jgi:hypothetical protein
MLARCEKCGVRFVVPDDRAANKDLRVRCKCGHEFALHAPRQAPAAAAPAARPPNPRSGLWRRCGSHPQVKSESVCPACAVGFCRDCEKRVQNVPTCPRCEGLCVDAIRMEEDLARDTQRARTMKDDIGFILAYPFTDRIAYVMLALFTWFFSFFASMAMGVVLSKGVLVWYSFTALTKVSSGRFRGYMPNFGDISDIVHPLRLSLAAFLAASWPLLALVFWAGPIALIKESRAAVAVVHAQEAGTPPGESSASEEDSDSDDEDEEEPGEAASAAERERARMEEEAYEEPGTPVHLKLAFVIAWLWQLLYMPMALIVAAISRGFVKTLNPLIGVEAIARMGSAYWVAAVFYSVLTAGEAILSRLLSIVPIAGSLVASFIGAYVALATGCALGLAVFKKAKELNLD